MKHVFIVALLLILLATGTASAYTHTISDNFNDNQWDSSVWANQTEGAVGDAVAEETIGRINISTRSNNDAAIAYLIQGYTDYNLSIEMGINSLTSGGIDVDIFDHVGISNANDINNNFSKYGCTAVDGTPDKIMVYYSSKNLVGGTRTHYWNGTGWNKTYYGFTYTTNVFYPCEIERNATHFKVGLKYPNGTYILQSNYTSLDEVRNGYSIDYLLLDEPINNNGRGRAYYDNFSMNYSLPTLSGYVNNTLGAYVDGAKVELGGYSTYTRTTPLLNTTDLGDYGTGERLHSVTYSNNQTDVDVYLIFHVIGSGAPKHVDTNVTMDNGVVLDRDYNTTAGSGVHEHFSYFFTAPKGIGYKITNSSTVSQLEWREAPHVSGYYSVMNLSDGNYTILTRAISYRNSTNTTSIIGNTTVNFTLQERTLGTVTAPNLNITAVIFIFVIVFYIHRTRRTS